MPRSLAAAALAAAALALPAPAAHAGDPAYGCRFTHALNAVAPVTGDGIWLFAAGYVAHPGDAVSVTCFVRADGADGERTPTGTGDGVATTSGYVRYFPAAGRVLEKCATATVAGHAPVTRCTAIRAYQMPPQEVIDLVGAALDAVDAVLVEHVDPPVCDALTEHEGSYGPVEIGPGGDVTAAGEVVWNCPPYAAA